MIRWLWLPLLLQAALGPASLRAPREAAPLAPGPQDRTPDRGQERPTPAAIVDRLEKVSAAWRGAVLDVAITNEPNVFQSVALPATKAEVVVTAAGDVQVRTREDATESDPEHPFFYELSSTPEIVETLDADGISQWRSWNHHLGSGPFRVWADRVRPEGQRRGSANPSPPAASGLNLASFLFHLYSPRRAFAFAADLEVEGRRRLAGRDCHVLRSAVIDKETSVTRWFVDVETGRLRRMVVQQGVGPVFQNSRWSWQIEEAPDGSPSSVLLISDSASILDYEGRSTFTLKPRRGAAVPVVKSPEDLYAVGPFVADAAPPPPGRDPAADYAWVLARLAARSQDFAAVFRPAGVKPPHFPDETAVLERIVKATGAPGPLRNLVRIYAADGAGDKLAALADRLDAERAPAPLLLGEVAAGLESTGRAKRALALLEKADTSTSAETRVLAWLAVGDLAKAAAGFEVMADPPRVERFTFLLTEETMKGVKPGDWLAALDAAVAARPKSPAAHAARILALLRGEDVGRFADAVRASFQQAGDPALAFGMRQLRLRIRSAHGDSQAAFIMLAVGPGAIPKIDPEKLKPAIKPLIAAAEAAGTGPRARLLRGRARLLDGGREAALAEFAAAFDAAVALPPEEFQDVAADIAGELDALGDDALLEKTCLGVLRSIQSQGLRRGVAALMNGDESNPVGACVRFCHRKKDYAPLFHALKRLRSTELRPLLSWLPSLGEIDFRQFFATACREVKRDPADTDGRRWLAAAAAMEGSGFWDEDIHLEAVEFLEPLRKTLPEDAWVLQSLVSAYERRNDLEKASAAGEDLRRLLEARGCAGAGEWTLSAALVTRARQQRQAHQEDAAGATLESIDPARMELPGWVGWAAALQLEELGRLDRAAEVLGWIERDGYRPYVKLAALHEKRKDWAAAMRCLNRALARGSDPSIDPPQPMFGGGAVFFIDERPDEEPAEPSDPVKMKAALYRQIGEDYFIDRLSASTLPPLPAEEAKRAEEDLKRLSSDDPGEREEALASLKRLGPACAPVLKAGLASTDEEVRSAVRRMLVNWSEPK